MESQYASLVENQPQQKIIEFGGVTFRSDFDSGNLQSVVQVDANTVTGEM